MMNKYTIAIAVAASALSLNSCVPIEDSGQYQSSGNYANHHNHHNHHIQYNQRNSYTPQQQSPSYGQPLRAAKGQGSVAIFEGARRVSTCYTASPNIERTRFISEQNQIVVKSRGSHGPATVELFNTQNGAKLGTVKAYELANGGPTWAAGMAD